MDPDAQCSSPRVFNIRETGPIDLSRSASLTPKLSKPRLVKQRRHTVSTRDRPPQPRPSEARRGAQAEGFNPFRGNEGDASILQETLSGWNPFNDRSTSQSPIECNTSSSNGFDRKESEDKLGFKSVRGSSESGSIGFAGSSSSSIVFGAGKEEDFGSSRNSASNATSGSSKFVFTSSDNNKALNFGRRSCTGHDRNMDSRLPDELSKLKIGDSHSEERCDSSKDDNHNKLKSDAMNSRLPEEMRKLNIDQRADEAYFDKPIVDQKNTFFFGGSSPVVDPSASTVIEEIARLNLSQSGGGAAAFERVRGADLRSSEFISKNAKDSLAGVSANNLPEEMKKLNITNKPTESMKDGNDTYTDTFIYGRNLKKEHFSAPHDEITVTSLPDDTEKPAVGVTNEGFKHNTTDFFVNEYNRPLSDRETKVTPLIPEVKFNSGFTENFNNRKESSSNLDSSSEGMFGTSQSVFSTTSSLPSHNMGCNYMSSYNAEPPLNQLFEDPVFSQLPAGFTFSTSRGAHTSHMDYRTPFRDTPLSSEENFLAGTHPKFRLNLKKGVSKDPRLKKRRPGHRPVSPDQRKDDNFFPKEDTPKENSEVDSRGSYSPMDFSPYRETLVSDISSTEKLVSLDESVTCESHYTSSDAQQQIPSDAMEALISGAQQLVINEKEMESHELDDDAATDNTEIFVDAESSFMEEQDLESNFCDQKTTVEKVDMISGSNNFLTESELDISCSNPEKQATDSKPAFIFSSNLDGRNQSNFCFTASSLAQVSYSSSKQVPRSKSQANADQDLFSSFANGHYTLSASPTKPFTLPTSFTQPELPQKHSIIGASSVSQSKDDRKTTSYKKAEIKQESVTPSLASAAIQDACEKWRIRGNDAYVSGDLSKAEYYYTRGVDCVPSNVKSGSCLRALMLCYSNRAAIRMTLGRMREALSDCMIAIGIDSKFLKAQIRAANCLLALGETEDAFSHFQKCLQLINNDTLGVKHLEEVSDGLQKTQKVAETIDNFTNLLENKRTTDMSHALQTISDALLISPHSERLTKLKADILLKLRKYDEVIMLCESTVETFERNYSIVTGDARFKEGDKGVIINWWGPMISKAYFYLGRLEEALDFLQRHESGVSFVECPDKSLSSFAATIKELLRLKASGNDAFQAGRHSEAVEHYTAALATVDSRPFAAICFCNRAAAYQALGQLTDAIADCSLAMALDSNYPKAISRRATLHQTIRDYCQAIKNLNRLISLLERQAQEKYDKSGTVVPSLSSGSDLKQARLRLAAVEEESKEGLSLDMYKILGVQQSSSSVDIKKAYRRAALRHHPDKAGQLLVKGDSGDDGIWKDIADEVHKDADRLFKMIGEAYTMLSDPTQRKQYDADEEMTNILKKGDSGGSTSKTYGEPSSSHYEKSSSRRQAQYPWDSHRRWSQYSSNSGRYN